MTKNILIQNLIETEIKSDTLNIKETTFEDRIKMIKKITNVHQHLNLLVKIMLVLYVTKPVVCLL